MNLICFMPFLFILMFSCEPKQRSLNKSLGWESDHEVKLVYVKGHKPDTSGYAHFKKELDTKIAVKLTAAHLGELAENDTANQTDLLFVVPKDYQQSLELIIKETRSSGHLKKFQVFEREYVSESEWVDKVIHAE